MRRVGSWSKNRRGGRAPCSRSYTVRHPLLHLQGRAVSNPTPTPTRSQFRCTRRNESLCGDATLEYGPSRSDPIPPPSAPRTDPSPDVLSTGLRGERAVRVSCADEPRPTYLRVPRARLEGQTNGGLTHRPRRSGPPTESAHQCCPPPHLPATAHQSRRLNRSGADRPWCLPPPRVRGWGGPGDPLAPSGRTVTPAGVCGGVFLYIPDKDLTLGGGSSRV